MILLLITFYMMGIVYGQAKSATPEPSAFGTILIPSYGRRVGKSSEYFVHTNGRFSTATETSSLKNVINVTEMARAPQSLSWLDNFRARAAYFRTWAIGDFYIDLLFENTSSALNTTVYVGKDGWFSGYSTIATKEKERVFYRAKDIPLKTYISLAEEEGYAIVSDVDDTIKVTNVLSKLGAIPNLFAKTFMTTPGMPDYYASLSTGLAINTSEGFYSKPTFHYLTASPVQYLPALQPFLEQFYPRGEVLANVFSMGTASQLTSYYTFKVTGGSTIHAFFPKKQLILVGDNAPAYAELYQKFPDSIACIFIRNVYDKKFPTKDRFDLIFSKVPKDKWNVFDSTQDLPTAHDIKIGGCHPNVHV